jgi:hypothetical protein
LYRERRLLDGGLLKISDRRHDIDDKADKDTDKDVRALSRAFVVRAAAARSEWQTAANSWQTQPVFFDTGLGNVRDYF